MIDKETEARILRLAQVEHWPVGTIARELGIHHDPVRRVLRQHGVPEVAAQPRPSQIEPYLPFILETWKKHPRLCASRLFRMCQERGYLGNPHHFRHLMARHRPRPPAEAFLRLRTLPGEQGQVDWAHFGHLQIGRARRPLVAFAMVLSYSRAIFVRFMLALRTEDFLLSHQRAFDYFGGVPRVLLYDNLKSAVLERFGDAIRFNPTLLSFAGHYLYEPRPVSVARGNEKGRVERALGYVRTDFFEGLTFHDLDDLNDKARAWCEGPSLERPWREDPRKSVRQVLAEERPRLLPLPQNPFPVMERRECSVGRTPYVRFDLNDYSVPHTLVGRSLVVVATQEEVRILDGLAEVARHRRSYDAREQIEDPAHLAALLEEKRRARRHRGIDRLSHAAPSSRLLLTRLAERGLNIGHSTYVLLQLLDTYGAEALERAVGEVLGLEGPHVHAVRQVLEREQAARGRPPATPLALPDDARIRDLSVRPHPLEGYDALASDPGPSPQEPT